MEQAQVIQTEANVVGRPTKKARKTPGPRLKVLKVGGSPGDAIKKARDYSTPRHLMTVAEIAEYLKFRRITIYRWARKGKIPAFKIGTDWRFDGNAIEKLMINRQVNG